MRKVDQWLLFFGIAVGSLMSGIDFLALSVAIHPMSQSLGIDIGTLQWFLSAFAIGNSSFLVTSGRLCDLYGRKMIFVIGSLIFILSSALIAFSFSPFWIIIARLVQGASSGITTSAGIAILAHLYSPQERTRWIAGLVGMTGLGMVLGPLVGGFLIEWYSWRMIFLINLPLGLIGLLFTLFYMPKQVVEERKEKLDLIGMALFTTTLILFTVGISQGQYWGWFSLPTVLVSGATILTALLFILAEFRTDSPLIDLKLLKVNNFLSSNAIACTLYFTLTSWTFLFGIYLQRVVGMTPREAGMVFLPFGLMVLLLSTQMDKLARRFGIHRWIAFGSLIGFIALAGMALLPIMPNRLLLTFLFLLYGASFVIINSCTMQTALEFVPLNRAGLAAGKSMMFRWLSGAVGVAVTSAIFLAAASNRMIELEGGRVLEEQWSKESYHHGLVVCLAILALFMLAGYFIRNLKER